jgi:Ion channel
MNQIFKSVRNFWAKDKSFTFLLVVLSIYIFGIIPLLKEDDFSKIVYVLFYYLLLTSGIPFFLKRNKKLIVILLFVLPFVFLIIEISYQSIWIQMLTDILMILYFLMLGLIILFRTFDQGRISKRRVQGAIIVYLLVGLIFCLVYHSIFIYSSIKSFNGLVGSHRKEFLYFSLCTLTTDGYGDIIPITPLARSLSNLEALAGQLYPAVLIARLVSMEFYARRTQA